MAAVPLGNDTELVLNLLSTPPPPPPPQAILEHDPTRGRMKPTKRDVLIDCPEGAAQTKLQIKVNAATREDPSKYIVIHAKEDVLRRIDPDGNVLAAFKNESGFLGQLPAGRLKELVASLTGQSGRTCIKHDHIQNSDMVFEIVSRSSTGARKVDKMLVEGIEHSSLNMRNDYDSKNYTGAQGASFSIMARDLYDAGNGYVIIGPSYHWDHQYVHDIIPAALQTLFYDKSLFGLEDDGTKVGEVLHFNTRSDASHADGPLLIFSGYSQTENSDVILAGEHNNIPVRTSMGISFTFDRLPPSLRETVSGSGNPSLTACHGFVLGIADTVAGIELTVIIALTSDNLPSFLKWPRLPQESVFQTNLQAIIPAKCVVSSFKIVPVQFHSLSGFIPEDRRALGKLKSQPIERDVYVAGHLDFVPGAFLRNRNSRNEAQSDSERLALKDWNTRYANESYKAFALLSDFCARGGAITDRDFEEHHAPWKERYQELTRLRDGGRRLPKVTVSSVSPFPASAALATIYRCARLLAWPGYGPYIFELRAAVRRFAESKTRRVKHRPGAAVSVLTNLPGAVLMQLVHEYTNNATVFFKEGAVDAVVDVFDSFLLGGDNRENDTESGVFNLEGSGIVEFFAPITFRWVLYNPKKSAEHADIGVEGRAEIIFRKYVAKDRHGADLAGELITAKSEGGEARGKKRKAGQIATRAYQRVAVVLGKGR
jgi:hypothetical protein